MIEEACVALREQRLVTLTGPAGVGKSLIARHTVLPLDPVWLDTRGADSVAELIVTWAGLLGQELGPGDAPEAALIRHLAQQPRVTVLDGISAEAIRALRPLLEAVITGTTHAAILCTSVQKLGSRLEHHIRVPPLAIPLPGEPLAGTAMELFSGRMAGSGGPLLDLERDEVALRRLLEASGGNPLMIEQMAGQAAQVGVDRVVPPDTIIDATAASYAMVDEISQRAYRRLGTLGFSVGSAVFAALVGQPRVVAAGVAAQLYRHALVEVTPEGRVRMLAPVRRHALEVGQGGVDAAQARESLIAWADEVLPALDAEEGDDGQWLDDLSALEAAVAWAAREDHTRDLAYELANRAFDPLYVRMRTAEALTLFETVLASGMGPPDIGGQVSRRAGICASETRGTFEGLRFLDIAEQHAARSDNPDAQFARTRCVRAEMYLDAGQLGNARSEVDQIEKLKAGDSYSLLQARRTLMDIEVSAGNLTRAEEIAPLVMDGTPAGQEWLAICGRILLAQIALEQGRRVEALATAQSTRADALARGDERLALLADLVARREGTQPAVLTPDPDTLPWAMRLGFLLEGARDAARRGEHAVAAGRATDVVVLADSARLERDGVAARLLLADLLLADGDVGQAISTYAAAARRAAACPMPLRLADAYDGLAAALADRRPGHAAKCAWVAAHLRGHRGAVPLARPGLPAAAVPRPKPAPSWVADGDLTIGGLVASLRVDEEEAPVPSDSPVASLTKAQLAVAELVGAGLTSKEIGERLYLSPRTVDNHLAQIYRRLSIPSRARLASLMADLPK